MRPPADLICIGDTHLVDNMIFKPTAPPWFQGGDDLQPGQADSDYALGLSSPFSLPLPWAPASWSWVLRRHGDRWNIVFCDGHVGCLKTKDLFDCRSASVRSRWNRDDLPH